MIRFIIRRLVIIPPALLLLNFLGFSYAYLVRPQRAARTPYLRAILPDTEPLLPTYIDYLKGLLDLDLGMMPSTEEMLVDALTNATVASFGLLGLALGLSVVIGWLPYPARRGQDLFVRVKGATQRGADMIVKPILIPGSLASALWRGIDFLVGIFRSPKR